MEVIRMPIAELRPAPYNPRVELQPGDERYERLKRSLDEFDLVQPLVFNRRTGHLVGGHQRLQVLRHEGATEVDCVVVDLPLEREKALNVALNNPRVGGDWDPDRLVPLLEELENLPDVDATLTGFSEEQLRDLVLAPSAPPEPRLDEEDSDAVSLVTATLETPHDRWPAVRQHLDALLAAEKAVTLHVRMPPHG